MAKLTEQEINELVQQWPLGLRDSEKGAIKEILAKCEALNMRQTYALTSSIPYYIDTLHDKLEPQQITPFLNDLIATDNNTFEEFIKNYQNEVASTAKSLHELLHNRPITITAEGTSNDDYGNVISTPYIQQSFALATAIGGQMGEASESAINEAKLFIKNIILFYANKYNPQFLSQQAKDSYYKRLTERIEQHIPELLDIQNLNSHNREFKKAFLDACLKNKESIKSFLEKSIKSIPSELMDKFNEEKTRLDAHISKIATLNNQLLLVETSSQMFNANQMIYLNGPVPEKKMPPYKPDHRGFLNLFTALDEFVKTRDEFNSKIDKAALATDEAYAQRLQQEEDDGEQALMLQMHYVSRFLAR